MTDVSVAAQQILVQDPEVLSSGLIGFDETWTQGWVFPEVPGALIENSEQCAIVIMETDPWTDANAHNRAEFATLTVDIWADPSRNADKSVRLEDAKDKIKAVAKIVDRNFHLVHPAVAASDPLYMGAKGMPRIWGTEAEVTQRTGITIVSAVRNSGPQWNPMSNNPSGWRGRYTYHLQYSS
jgi:hypothetical protein